MPLRGRELLLNNFLRILTLLTEGIFVITGDFHKDFTYTKKVHVKNISYNTSKIKRSTLAGLIGYGLDQLRISANLMKVVNNVDLIIFFIANDFILPMLVAKLLKRKVILIVTGSASKSAKHIYKDRLYGVGGPLFSHIISILENLNCNFSDRIVVYSPSIISQLGLDKWRRKISTGGARFVDTDFFMPRKKLCDRRNVVAFFGRLSEEKGVMNFVRAIPLILSHRDDVKFLIGGDGPLLHEIEEEIINFKSEEEVKLVGWIPHDELPNYLNDIKLLVLPSYTEGLPNIVLEAMACGAPVLATSIGGLPDVIRDGENGFLLEDNSPECIARGVIRALNYPYLNKIAERARAHIEEEYTCEAAVERYKLLLLF